MNLTYPIHWKDYELIDSGDFKKLERFGKYITIRPEPQAVWDSAFTYEEWKKQANVEYQPNSANSGEWKKLKTMPENWRIQYPIGGNENEWINFRLALTAFKHVGIFPEQAVNWDFIFDQCQTIGNKPSVLNLFAYTGAASIVAAKAGAQVVHVDSVKQIVNWASLNAQNNNINTIRWMIDDAMKFVQREVRRGNKYQGIILDPPAFGHGPSGEDWKLERDINEMLKLIAQIADAEHFFLVLNIYSLGLSVLVLENLVQNIFKINAFDSGELFIPDKKGKKLPLGVYVQLKK
jgi:23S rRNA (cytosine1962-C5)-methyltransferase